VRLEFRIAIKVLGILAMEQRYLRVMVSLYCGWLSKKMFWIISSVEKQIQHSKE